jgi:SAM-dependent methyltransferase
VTDRFAELQSSVASGEADADWWNRAHRIDDPMWLSGTDATEIWERLGVPKLLRRGTRVLNIGVGMGYCTRALHARGCRVSAVDISEVALKRVEDVIVGYLADNLCSLPDRWFDVALSHLVAQHMYDDDLEAQMSAVMRALKPDGIFALHYAEPADGTLPNVNTPEAARGGGVLRQPEFIAAMADRTGGVIVSDKTREKHQGCRWRVAHIRPR